MTPTKYQLALQFPANSIADYDQMVQLENELIVQLRGLAKVDGHDCGSGEMNVFIYTDDPRVTFEKVKPVVAKRNLDKNMVAAYRETAGEAYTVVWPVGYTSAFRIT